MTGYYARGLCLGLGLVAFALETGSLSAQTPPDRSGGAVGAPVTLAPPQAAAPDASPAAPAPLVPARPAAKPGERRPPAAKILKGGAIRIDPLSALDPDSVGVLDESNGGLGIDLWAGTRRALVARLLPHLPAAPRSATARALSRRLLLSAARAPLGRAGKGEESLVALRVERLVARGDIVAARDLLRVVPQRLDEETLARARVNIAFLMGDDSAACDEVRAWPRGRGSVMWSKARVFCQLLAGDGAGAQIGAGLLQEQGVKDPAFFALLRILGGEEGIAVTGLEKAEPLHLAMLRKAKIELPRGATHDPLALRAIATGTIADMDTRLEAAEQAEARGALDTDALRKLYLAVTFTPEDLTQPLTRSREMPGPRGRALLYQAVRNVTAAPAQAEVLSRVLALSRGEGRAAVAVRVFRPELIAIAPAPALAWFAPQAGAALYAVGARAAAARWYAIARQDPEAATRQLPAGDAPAATPEPGAPVPRPADVALWPLAALAALPPKPSAVPPPAPMEPKTAVPLARAGGAKELAGAAAPSAPSTDVAAGTAPPPGTVQSVPLAAPKPAAGAFDAAMFDRWWKAEEADRNPRRYQRAERLLTLISALGGEVPDAVWLDLARPQGATANLADPALMEALERAAAGKRRGETVLLALIALGEDAPAAVHPARLGPVVAALRSVGLDDEARGLALEAAYGAGL